MNRGARELGAAARLISVFQPRVQSGGARCGSAATSRRGFTVLILSTAVISCAQSPPPATAGPAGSVQRVRLLGLSEGREGGKEE